jgi:putative ABC transport system permease protein
MSNSIKIMQADLINSSKSREARPYYSVITHATIIAVVSLSFWGLLANVVSNGILAFGVHTGLIVVLALVNLLFFIFGLINIANHLGIRIYKDLAFRSLNRDTIKWRLVRKSIIVSTYASLIAAPLLLFSMFISENLLPIFIEDVVWLSEFNLLNVSISLAIFWISNIFVSAMLLFNNINKTVDRESTLGLFVIKVGLLKPILISQVFLSTVLFIAGMAMAAGAYLEFEGNSKNPRRQFIIADVDLSPISGETKSAKAAVLEKLINTLESSANYDAAMIASSLPGFEAPLIQVDIANAAGVLYPSSGLANANYVAVLPGSLNKLKIPLIHGRYFEKGDFSSSEVVIVSQFFVDYYGLSDNGLGSRVRIVGERSDAEWLTIVGVVEQTNQGAVTQERAWRPIMYTMVTENDALNRLSLAVDSSLDASAVEANLSETLSSLKGSVVVSNVQRYAAGLTGNEALMKTISAVVVAFALSILMLASGTAYSFMSLNYVKFMAILKDGAEEFIIRKMSGPSIVILFLGLIPGLIVGGYIRYQIPHIEGVCIPTLTVVSSMATCLTVAAFRIAYIASKKHWPAAG